MVIKFVEELLTKTFTGDTMKDAYMTACKWYSTHILAKDELRGTCVEYVKDRQSTTVTIHVYVIMDEDEVRQEHCDVCKEFHHSFFINEANNCNSCNVLGYQKRLDRKIKVKRDCYKDKLGGGL